VEHGLHHVPQAVPLGRHEVEGFARLGQSADMLYGVLQSSSIEEDSLIRAPNVATISDPLAAGVFFLAGKLIEYRMQAVEVDAVSSCRARRP